MKPIRTWILIADGARARILSNHGPGKGLRAVDGMMFETDHAATQEIMADKPGRSFESSGTARHAMEYTTDPHRELKRRFAHELGDVLAKQIGEFDRLVLVAAPVSLGDLREALAPAVRAKITAEVAKDLTKTPNNDVASHLDDVMVV